MLIKLLQKIFGLCFFSGFFILFGTAGSSDLNYIDFKTALIQSGIAFALISVGFVGLKFTEWEYID